jgi:hypothetical protein
LEWLEAAFFHEQCPRWRTKWPLVTLMSFFCRAAAMRFQRHALAQKLFNHLEGRPHDQPGVILLGKFNFFTKNGVDF